VSVRWWDCARQAGCFVQGALCSLAVCPLCGCRRSFTERRVTVDLVAIAVRGDGHCRVDPPLPGLRFDGRRSHAPTPGRPVVDGCGNQ